MGRPIRGQQHTKPPDEALRIRPLRRLQRELATLQAVVMQRCQEGIAVLLGGVAQHGDIDAADGLRERQRQIEASQLRCAALTTVQPCWAS